MRVKVRCHFQGFVLGEYNIQQNFSIGNIPPKQNPKMLKNITKSLNNIRTLFPIWKQKGRFKDD